MVFEQLNGFRYGFRYSLYTVSMKSGAVGRGAGRRSGYPCFTSAGNRAASAFILVWIAIIRAFLDGESAIRSTTAILYRRKASSVISPPRHYLSDSTDRCITCAAVAQRPGGRTERLFWAAPSPEDVAPKRHAYPGAAVLNIEHRGTATSTCGTARVPDRRPAGASRKRPAIAPQTALKRVVTGLLAADYQRGTWPAALGYVA